MLTAHKPLGSVQIYKAAAWQGGSRNFSYLKVLSLTENFHLFRESWLFSLRCTCYFAIICASDLNSSRFKSSFTFMCLMKQFKNLEIVLTSKNPFNIDSISTTGFTAL